MEKIISLFADFGVFVILPWVLWRLTRKILPIVVLPILLGILFAVWHVPVGQWGIPSLYGNDIGWLAVLVLAFTAGLEMWQHPGQDPNAEVIAPTLGRLLGGAVVALGLPLVIGAVLVYQFFLPLHGWGVPHVPQWVAALSLGLCIAVSALPVPPGLVRELVLP